MNKQRILNIGFLLISTIIIIVLLLAPKESTPHVPYDDNHKTFYSMNKREAEKHCEKCHKKLSKNHPPKQRCLLCHKKGK
jgi:uncharacterized paraquat-inducible protein A